MELERGLGAQVVRNVDEDGVGTMDECALQEFEFAPREAKAGAKAGEKAAAAPKVAEKTAGKKKAPAKARKAA